MRSLLAWRGRSLFAAAVALLYLCNVGLANGEEIVFYGDDGSIFTITITGGCYNFKSNWNKKAVAGEVDHGCFEVWDGPDCRGDKRQLTKGAEGLRDFNKIGFNKKISSVSLCDRHQQEQGPISGNRYPSNQIYPTFPSNTNDNFGPAGGNRPAPTLNSENMQKVRDAAVAEHNKYRARHGAPPLQGDPSMHEEAQRYADYLAANNKFELNRNSRYIGNIASSFRREPEDAIKDAVGRWYDGVNYYDYNNPGFSRQAGSFTAVVWKSSQRMGIGAAWNRFQNNWVIISYYSPSPNLQGAFRENVEPFKN